VEEETVMKPSLEGKKKNVCKLVLSPVPPILSQSLGFCQKTKAEIGWALSLILFSQQIFLTSRRKVSILVFYGGDQHLFSF